MPQSAIKNLSKYIDIIKIMKIISMKTILGLATLMLLCAQSCKKDNQTSDTFNYDKAGIASVKIGAEYIDVPYSYPDLYSRAEYQVCCGGRDWYV